jgi:hypothetical protein
MMLKFILLGIGLVILFFVLKNALEELKTKFETIKLKKIKKVEEPHAEVFKGKGKITLKVMLPNIKSEKDVSLKKMQNSIEIKAYSTEKIYFKLFPVPKKSRIVSKKLQGEEFVLEIET